jgi:tetratricopeptide (TPR) repeat protein
MNAMRRTAGLVLMLGLLGAAVSGQDKGGELTEKERKQLTQQAGDLYRQGFAQYQKGRLEDAIRSTEQCLTLRRKLYPLAQYPDGHPDLAEGLHALGFLLEARREYAKAEPCYRDALAMRQKLFPTDKYPDGHPDLAGSLNALGFLLGARGEYARAERFCRDALAMSQRLAASFADASAEAEALNFLLAQLREARDLYLSVSANLPGASAAEAYAVLWQGKGALARALERTPTPPPADR